MVGCFFCFFGFDVFDVFDIFDVFIFLGIGDELSTPRTQPLGSQDSKHRLP